MLESRPVVKGSQRFGPRREGVGDPEFPRVEAIQEPVDTGVGGIHDPKTVELEPWSLRSDGGCEGSKVLTAPATGDDGEIPDEVPFASSGCCMLRGGDGAASESDSWDGEEADDVGVRRELDVEIKDPDRDVVDVLGRLSDGREVLSREEGENVGLDLDGEGEEHRERELGREGGRKKER